MVPRAGIEPATYPLGGDRAIHLCHRDNESLKVYQINVEKLTGFAIQREKYGTEGRNRTDTISLSPDFESGASTSSATPAQIDDR